MKKKQYWLYDVISLYKYFQDLHPDPPAPKYLRLHDSVSLDSSGPSTPQRNAITPQAIIYCFILISND